MTLKDRLSVWLFIGIASACTFLSMTFLVIGSLPMLISGFCAKGTMWAARRGREAVAIGTVKGGER
jgi:hypothetical protein